MANLSSISSVGDAPSATPARDPRRIAEDLVAVTFIQPLLRQAREMNSAPPPWGPGQGEKQFATFLDEHLASQIAQASRFPIIDRIASDLQSSASPERPSGPFVWPRSRLMPLGSPPPNLQPLAEA